MIEKVSPSYWDIQSVSQIKSASEAAKAFETEFIRMFLKEVRKELGSGVVGSSFSSKMYLDMFDMQLSKTIADSSGLGIKEYIEEAIKAYETNSKKS
ncbi:rod-binding protein [Nitrosophilus alvini]|uniref:rod-binding protein n=1 Tax=Nitrosophilus alvini TaxID=2714855 RepID=UPI00190C414C|nr:rod-binding protein [Nitrosophilus alvini]